MRGVVSVRVDPSSRALVTYSSKSEYAYDVLKRRILSEELAPGSVIGQERIAAEIGVSTTPLREALKRLATEGLVDLGAHRDARITELSAEEAASLFEIRRVLDPLAVGYAAERRTEDDLRAVRDALERLHPLTGTADWTSLEAHRAFHHAIYRASQNTELISILDRLWDKTDRYRQLALRTPRSAEDLDRSRREHHALADAVEAGDIDLAADLMREHIDHSLGHRALASLRDGD